MTNQTPEQMVAELNKLNPAQRKALRGKFGGRGLTYFAAATLSDWGLEYGDQVHHVTFQFAHPDLGTVQYSGSLGKRGGLSDVKFDGHL